MYHGGMLSASEDAAKAYANAVETLGEIEPDGPQFEASVYHL